MYGVRLLAAESMSYQPQGLHMADTWTHYLSESLAFPCVFFLLGVGILHSMEKATQLVHGTPKLAASQRTWSFAISILKPR